MITYRIAGWKLSFNVLEPIQAKKDVPEQAELLLEWWDGDDHMEYLYFKDGIYYRYAGGGRGFMFTQKLEPVCTPVDMNKALAFLRFIQKLKAITEAFNLLIEVE